MPKTLPSSGGAKRHPLNMRTTEAVRRRLEKAAAESGRSLAQEVEFDLERYLDMKEDLDLYSKPIIRTIAQGLRQAELNSGKHWYEDRATAIQFRKTLFALIDLLCPPGILDAALENTGFSEKENRKNKMRSAKLVMEANLGADAPEIAAVYDRLVAFLADEKVIAT